MGGRRGGLMMLLVLASAGAQLGAETHSAPNPIAITTEIRGPKLPSGPDRGSRAVAGDRVRDVPSTSSEDDGFVEPICDPRHSRLVLFPVQERALWEMYKKHEASFWTAEEIDLGPDKQDWERLDHGERLFVSSVLAFFAAADGIVVENLAERFCRDVKIPEARCFYGFQIAMENIHSETYSLLIDNFIKEPAERERLFDAINKVPTVQRKAEWALRWVGEHASFAERLIAFAAVEGIFFS